MIHYRTFRNSDSPGLAEVWNEALTGRGAVRLRTSSPLERYAYSKIFFDPEGLIIAEADSCCVGFAHAGFGSNAEGTALDRQAGVTCMVAVRPSHQRQGIGTELLHRSEQYLRLRGAVQLYAGPLAPLNPFYFGMYGGCDMPGFLGSDTAAQPFLACHNYQVEKSVRVVQRKLGIPLKLFDARFVGYRQRFELYEDVVSRLGSWWQYNLFNGAEPRVYVLLDKSNNQCAGKATFWDMDGFGLCWGYPVIGMVDWFLRADLRGQGIGKFMLVQMLRRAQEEMVEAVELHVPAGNPAIFRLCQALGFEDVDSGRFYKKAD